MVNDKMLATMNMSIMKLSNKLFLIKYLVQIERFFFRIRTQFLIRLHRNALNDESKASITESKCEYHSRVVKQSQFYQLNNLQ